MISRCRDNRVRIPLGQGEGTGKTTLERGYAAVARRSDATVDLVTAAVKPPLPLSGAIVMQASRQTGANRLHAIRGAPRRLDPKEAGSSVTASAVRPARD